MIKPPRNRHAAKLPKFWRPRLTPSQVLDARIVHNDLLGRIATGASPGDLWDWIETGFTYLMMMRLLRADGMEFTDEAMQALAQVVDDFEPIAERFRKTGRVGFTGPELMHAREAAAVMDELIALDRHGIAEKAALWSIEQRKRIKELVS